MDFNLISVIAALVVSISGSVWSLAWWLSKQFNSVRALVYDKSEQTQKVILEKLEYHERHDDTRFDSVTKDLWEIRVRNAAIDGRTLNAAANERNNIK